MTTRRPDRSRDLKRVALLLALFAALVLLLAGCGPSSLTQARQIVTAADRVEVTALESFGAWDAAHQAELRATTTTAAELAATVENYRPKRGAVAASLNALANASHAAKASLDAFEAAGAKQVDLAALLRALRSAVLAVRDATRVIGWSPPGLDGLLSLLSIEKAVN